FLDEVIVKRAPVLCHHPIAAGRFGSGFCALLLRHSGNLTRFAPLTRQESHPYPDCDRLHNQLHTGYTYGGSGRGSRAGRDTRDTLSPARQRRVAPSHATTGKAISWARSSLSSFWHSSSASRCGGTSAWGRSPS